MKLGVFFVALLLMLVGCSSRTVGGGPVGPVGPIDPGTGNINGSTHHNLFVYSRANGNYDSDYTRFNLWFEYTGFNLVVQAAHVTTGRALQVQVYSFDNSLIFQDNFDINGDLNREIRIGLRVRPAYVIIDAPDFTGNLVLTMRSYDN